MITRSSKSELTPLALELEKTLRDKKKLKMMTQKALAACPDLMISLMWEVQQLRESFRKQNFDEIQRKLDEFMMMQHTEDNQRSILVEVASQVNDLSNTFSDIYKWKDMLRERMNEISSEESNTQEKQDMPLELMSEVPDWNQSTEHQIAHEEQCILISELLPEEPNVHGKQCMVLELMSEIDRPQDEVSELREILEEESQEECNLIEAVTTFYSAKDDHFKHCIHSCKACDEILEYLANAEDFKALPDESVPYLDSNKSVEGGGLKEKNEEAISKLELKPLPAHIQFPFLEKGETFPVTVSADLSSLELKQVLDVGEDAITSLMVEHPTARALVDVDKGELELIVNDESFIISKSGLMKFHEDEGSTSLGERRSHQDDHLTPEEIHVRGRPLIDYPP